MSYETDTNDSGLKIQFAIHVDGEHRYPPGAITTEGGINAIIQLEYLCSDINYLLRPSSLICIFDCGCTRCK